MDTYGSTDVGDDGIDDVYYSERTGAADLSAISDIVNTAFGGSFSATYAFVVTWDHVGYYYQNNHATLTWTSPVFWIASQTSSGTTAVAIAIADEAKNVAMETIASEITAPVGPTFTAPANKAAGIAITSLAPTENRGTWVKYTVNAGSATILDQYTIQAEGDTLP